MEGLFSAAEIARLKNTVSLPCGKRHGLYKRVPRTNATEHMGEYISRFGKTSDSIGIRSQVMLESYSAALNVAMNSLAEKSPGRYFGMYGNWELGINTETGIVYHARMIY